MLVKSCLDQNSCDSFNNYFDYLNHSMGTRNNNISVKLPRIKLESTKKGFYYYGAVEFNKLPRDIRELRSIMLFKRALQQHFI